MTRPLIEAFVFRTADKPLFGIYHHPRGRVRRTGVLLAPPAQHEYIPSHRLYRQLALSLADTGYAVMRFDLFGCGDSGGEGTDGSLAQWRVDVTDALRALRARSAAANICMAGCRLGASLAAMSASDVENVTALVLWDPLVRGADWVDELRGEHQTMLLKAHVDRRKASGEEALGFPLSHEQERELRALDLLSLTRCPGSRALIVSSDGQQGESDLARHLRSLGCATDFASYRDPGTWTWVEDMVPVRVPANILRDVVKWIDEVCP